MSEEAVKTLPKRVFKNDFKNNEILCAICQAEFEHGDNLIILECGHGYHEKCIEKWLTGSKRQCPICKQTVSTVSVLSTDESDDFSGGNGNQGPEAKIPRTIQV